MGYCISYNYEVNTFLGVRARKEETVSWASIQRHLEMVENILLLL